jgi:DNA-binding CsgD family transcriptional regulator
VQIEKVSRYISVQTPSRSMSGANGVRRMLLSLPRVKWLELDPDYKPFGGIDDEIEPPPKPSSPKPGSPLSGRELEIWNLRMMNMSFADIAAHFGVTRDTVRGMYARARKKRDTE